MATLTDEEKAAKVLGDVDAEKQDETAKPAEAESNEEQENQVDKTAEEIEAEAEAEAEPETEIETPTFTKKFQNLKGDTPQDYAKELETAYENSTTEALRWKTIAEEGARLVEEAKRVVAGQPAAATQTTPTDPNLLAIDSNPDVQYAKTLRERDMISAFEKFKKSYPQVTEEAEFNKFTKASDGLYRALEVSTGRKPTYAELYDGIAGALHWQPVDKTDKKDNAIKESLSSSQTVSSTQPTSKQSKVSDAEADVYMKLTGKNRTDAVKDLETVK
jgi:hypothetical protein